MDKISVIKSDVDNPFLIWKYPEEDFISGSQLIVNPAEEAIFLNNGLAEGPYAEGKYSLTTDSLPWLKRFFTRTENGVSPFHAQVYFIKMTEQMGIKWGTDSKVLFIDQKSGGHQWYLGARGELSIKVTNSRKLLFKLVGSESGMHCEHLFDFFRAPIMMHVKAFLPRVLQERGVSIFELDQYLAEYSNDMRLLLSRELEEYGISLEKFWIVEFLKPEDDPTFIKLRDISGRNATIGLEAGIRQQEALMEQNIELIRKQTDVEKERMQKQMEINMREREQAQLGYSYREKRQFDVMEAMAKNEGTGSDLRNAAMGIGMGFGMGGPIGGAFGSLATSTMNFGSEPPIHPGYTQQEPISGGGVHPGDSFLELEEESNTEQNGETIGENGGICFCTKCGKQMSVDDIFCSRCGTKRGV